MDIELAELDELNSGIELALRGRDDRLLGSLENILEMQFNRMISWLSLSVSISLALNDSFISRLCRFLLLTVFCNMNTKR